jgi:hypothetical protein
MHSGAGDPGKLGCPAGMIRVAVRNQNMPDPESPIRRCGGKLAGLEAWVHRGRISVSDIAEEIAKIPVSAELELEETALSVGAFVNDHSSTSSACIPFNSVAGR